MPEHRILADEHISKTIVSKLNSYGIDAVHITEENLRGSPDTDIAEYASKQNRIVLTRDDDFRKLSDEQNIGVLYLTKRLTKKQSAAEVMKVLNMMSMDEIQNEIIHLPWK